MDEFVDKETKWVYENYDKDVTNLTAQLKSIASNLFLPVDAVDPLESIKNNFEWFNYYHREMFLDVNKIHLDFINFSKFLSNRNNALYGDHTIAYRLINLSKIYPQLNKNDQEIAINILNLDYVILSDDSFTIMSKGYNHAVDQIFGMICYHHYVNPIDSNIYKKLTSDLKFEIDNSVDDCFIHIENTPDYHYYAMQRLTEINKVIEDPEISLLLLKMAEYLSYIVPYDGFKLINLGDASGKYIWGDLNVPITKRSDREQIKWFKTGYLFYSPNEVYFHCKSSKRHWNHHHYDNTSFVFWHGGENFIVDSGTYSYEHGHPNREYCQSPYAHNILCLPDKNLLLNAHNIDQYKTHTLKISENTFKFEVKMYADAVTQRVVTLNKNEILFQDKIIQSQSEQHDYDFAYSLIHLHKDSKISKISDGEFLIALNLQSIKINIENPLGCEFNLIEDGFYQRHMVGFHSDSFYNFCQTPTLLLKVPKNGNSFECSYRISWQ